MQGTETRLGAERGASRRRSEGLAAARRGEQRERGCIGIAAPTIGIFADVFLTAPLH